jgi:hypothetical protein
MSGMEKEFSLIDQAAELKSAESPGKQAGLCFFTLNNNNLRLP